MILDREQARARQPCGPQVPQQRQDPSDRLRRIDPESRRGRPRSDMDPHIGTAEGRHGVFVGRVVAEEDDCGGADLAADAFKRLAFVGAHDRELDDVVAAAGVDAVPCRGAGLESLSSRL